ncbi:hypothetical protein AB1484_32685 [Parafrankia sp. FMc6]|uniref:hypothetical protein n=1 Tax=Parafrankia soli TaxID=2599596 RepID=UPI0034D41F10
MGGPCTRADAEGIFAALIDINEVAELLGVGKSRADTLSRSKGFPDPAVERPRIRLWYRPDVLAWRDRTRP